MAVNPWGCSVAWSIIYGLGDDSQGVVDSQTPSKRP